MVQINFWFEDIRERSIPLDEFKIQWKYSHANVSISLAHACNHPLFRVLNVCTTMYTQHTQREKEIEWQHQQQQQKMIKNTSNSITYLFEREKNMINELILLFSTVMHRVLWMWTAQNSIPSCMGLTFRFWSFIFIFISCFNIDRRSFSIVTFYTHDKGIATEICTV